MRRMPGRGACAGAAFALLLALSLGAAPGARGAVNLALVPDRVYVNHGEFIDVEIVVTESGDAFNGFEAHLTFDPTVLAYVPQPGPAQEGPLMTAVCGLTFHSFGVAATGDSIKINENLLCAGQSVTGPGIIYRLRFEAVGMADSSDIAFTSETAFFLNGLYVTPVVTTDTRIWVHPLSPVPDAGLVTGQLQAAPNPFNPATTISFVAAEAAHARVSVFTPRGNLVAGLFDGPVPPGRHEVVWRGADGQGRRLGSGMYLVRLEIGGRSFTRRITMIK